MRSNAFTQHHDKVQAAQWKLDHVEYEKNRLARIEAKKKAVELNKYVVKFVEKNIKPGHIVSFNGTRSYPLREVKQCTSLDIMGLVVSGAKKVKGILEFTYTGHSSTNSIDKLKAWYNEDAKDWVQRAGMIEEGKKLI